MEIMEYSSLQGPADNELGDGAGYLKRSDVIVPLSVRLSMMYAKFSVFRNFSVFDKHNLHDGKVCAVDGLENCGVCVIETLKSV